MQKRRLGHWIPHKCATASQPTYTWTYNMTPCLLTEDHPRRDSWATYPVVGLDVQEKRRHHGHSFLTGDGSRLVLTLQELVDVLQALRFPQLCPAEVELPGQLVRVPFQSSWGLVLRPSLLRTHMLSQGCTTNLNTILNSKAFWAVSVSP
jgi:hypothetical protein